MIPNVTLSPWNYIYIKLFVFSICFLLKSQIVLFNIRLKWLDIIKKDLRHCQHFVEVREKIVLSVLRRIGILSWKITSPCRKNLEQILNTVIAHDNTVRLGFVFCAAELIGWSNITFPKQDRGTQCVNNLLRVLSYGVNIWGFSMHLPLTPQFSTKTRLSDVMTLSFLLG